MISVNIGEILKEKRLQKNITLDELQQITKIQKRYLIAIEENDFNIIPGKFYVRAFIRQYAEAIEMNGEELVDIYDGKKTQLEKQESKETYQPLDESRIQHHEKEQPNSWLLRNLPAVTFSLIGAAILIIVLYVTWQDHQNDSIIQTTSSINVNDSASASIAKSKSQEKAAASSTSSSTSTSSSEEQKTKIETTNETNRSMNVNVTNTTSPVKVEFSGKSGPCWVGIMVNGAYVYQHTLQSNEKQATELPASASNATIVLGASNNVNVHLNDQEISIAQTPVLVQKNIIATIAYKN